MAPRPNFIFAISCALFFAFVRRMGRFDSAFSKIFSLVQPRFHACEHHRRAARHARADEQPRRARLRRLFSVGDGIFHVRDDLGERNIHKNSRRVFLRSRAVVDFNRHLLFRSCCHFERLAENVAEKDFRRGDSDFDRCNLFLALGNFTR